MIWNTIFVSTKRYKTFCYVKFKKNNQKQTKAANTTNLRGNSKPSKQNKQSQEEGNSPKGKFKWLTNMEKYFIWLLKKKGKCKQVARLLFGSGFCLYFYYILPIKWRNKKFSVDSM